MHRAETIGVLDDGFDAWDYLSALLYDAAAMLGSL